MTPQELLNLPLDGGDGLDFWLGMIHADGHFGDEYDTPEKLQAYKLLLAKKIIDAVKDSK